MAKLPEFLLRSLYIKGSLQNTAAGFVFQMRNELGPARIIGARPLQLDRKPIPLEACHFILGSEEAAFNQVSPDNSVLMRKGESVTIRVAGSPLRNGRHSLGINFEVKDMGAISFSITDQVG